MPNTRSKDKPLTPEELELYTQRLEEKERRLQEQAAAMQARQKEIEQQQASGSDAMDQITQKLSLLDSLPHQLEMLSQRISQIQDSSQYTRAPPPQVSLSPRVQSQQDFQAEPSPIRLKDAIDTIPKYDGHKMSVFHFSKICERALELIPQYHEYHLVQLIINKLQGHAYSAVEGVEFHSVFELTRRLKKIFGPNKSTDQYRGELANIYMKPGEDIFDYVARVKELCSIIIDCETDMTGYISEETRDQINHTAMTSFVNGLPSDLLIRVKLEGCHSFEDSIATAIQLSKTIEAENARKRTFNPNRPSRADFAYGNQQSNPPAVFKNRGPVAQPTPLQPTIYPRNNQQPFIKPLIPGLPGPNFPATKICRFCKNPGHFMSECRKFAYRQSLEQAQQRASIPQNPGNSQSVPATDARRSEIPQGRQTQAIPLPNVNVVMTQEQASLPPESIK